MDGLLADDAMSCTFPPRAQPECWIHVGFLRSRKHTWTGEVHAAPGWRLICALIMDLQHLQYVCQSLSSRFSWCSWLSNADGSLLAGCLLDSFPLSSIFLFRSIDQSWISFIHVQWLRYIVGCVVLYLMRRSFRLLKGDTFICHSNWLYCPSLSCVIFARYAHLLVTSQARRHQRQRRA